MGFIREQLLWTSKYFSESVENVIWHSRKARPFKNGEWYAEVFSGNDELADSLRWPPQSVSLTRAARRRQQRKNAFLARTTMTRDQLLVFKPLVTLDIDCSRPHYSSKEYVVIEIEKQSAPSLVLPEDPFTFISNSMAMVDGNNGDIGDGIQPTYRFPVALGGADVFELDRLRKGYFFHEKDLETHTPDDSVHSKCLCLPEWIWPGEPPGGFSCSGCGEHIGQDESVRYLNPRLHWELKLASSFKGDPPEMFVLCDRCSGPQNNSKLILIDSVIEGIREALENGCLQRYVRENGVVRVDAGSADAQGNFIFTSNGIQEALQRGIDKSVAAVTETLLGNFQQELLVYKKRELVLKNLVVELKSQRSSQFSSCGPRVLSHDMLKAIVSEVEGRFENLRRDMGPTTDFDEDELIDFLKRLLQLLEDLLDKLRQFLCR